MHWMNAEQIEEINKKIVLSRIEDLNLIEYDIRVDSRGDLMLTVEDPKYSGTAYASFNLSKGYLEEICTGAVKGDFLDEMHDYSRRIAELALIERELHI